MYLYGDYNSARSLPSRLGAVLPGTATVADGVQYATLEAAAPFLDALKGMCLVEAATDVQAILPGLAKASSEAMEATAMQESAAGKQYIALACETATQYGAKSPNASVFLTEQQRQGAYVIANLVQYALPATTAGTETQPYVMLAVVWSVQALKMFAPGPKEPGAEGSDFAVIMQPTAVTTKADEKTKKGAMPMILGAAAGGAAGFFMAGPVGAAAGAAGGALLASVVA